MTFSGEVGTHPVQNNLIAFTVKLLNKGCTHWALNLSDGGCPFPKFKVQIQMERETNYYY